MKKLHKLGLFFAFALLVAFALPAGAQTTPPDAAKSAADKAIAWLQTMQHDDGGYGPNGGNTPSTLGQTDDAIFAFAAAGKAPAGISKGGKSLTYFLLGHIAQAKSAGETCKTALAAATSLPASQTYGSVDVYARIDSFYNSTTAMYGSSTIDDAYCLLAQKQLGRTIPAGAVAALSKLQISDGSWAFAGAGKPSDGDTNTTALTIQALVANGVDKGDATMSKALAYLKTQQNADGGFPYQNPSQYGTDTDANSTAYVVQGLLALGADPAAAGGAWDKGKGATPLAALLKLQVPSGAFIFQAATNSENILATLQAIPALEYATQPQPPVRSDASQTYPTPDITSLPAVVATPTSAAAAPTATVAAQPAIATPVSSGPGLPHTGNPDFGGLAIVTMLALLAVASGLLLRNQGFNRKGADLSRWPFWKVTMRRLFTTTFLMFVLLLAFAPVVQSAPAQHRAALVVRWAGNRVGTYVVNFSEDSISGADLLQRAFGPALEMDWQAGGLVAAISGVGCHPPAESAFCQCQGSTSCIYWRYYHLKAGHWVYSNMGAASYQLHDGDVDGWSWAGSDTPPPVYTFAQLTAPFATSTPRSAGSGTAALTSTPVHIIRPSATPALPTATFSLVDPTVKSVVTNVPTSPALAVSPTISPTQVPSPTPMTTPSVAPAVSTSMPTAVLIPATVPSAQNPGQPPSAMAENQSLLLPILSLLPFIFVLALVLRRRGTGYSLDSRTWLAWLLAALLLVSGNPYYLLMLLLVCLSVYLACASSATAGVSGGILLRFGLVITFFVALFNFLTAHYGDTIIARLPQDWPTVGGVLTLEGLVAGLLRGLTLLTLLAVFAVFNRLVDHYELLKLTPRPLYRIGLAASIAVAFVPQTLAAARDIAAAQQLRGYRVRVRDMLPLFAPLLTLGLEKAIQMAEALETRAWGYNRPGLNRTRYRHVTLRRADYLVIATSFVTASGAILMRLAGWLADYYPYPSLALPPFSLAAMLILLLLVPTLPILLGHGTSNSSATLRPERTADMPYVLDSRQ